MAAPPAYVHVLALGIDRAWRARPPAERRSDLSDLGTRAAEAAALDVTTLSYGSIGLEPRTDLLLWRTGPAVDALESAAASVLAGRLGHGWTCATPSWVGPRPPST